MTPIRETIARAIHEADHGPMRGVEWALLWATFPDEFAPRADAVLRALDEAGMVVGATDPASEARRGLDWFERTFGVPLGDKPGREDVERVRAMISASVVE